MAAFGTAIKDASISPKSVLQIGISSARQKPPLTLNQLRLSPPQVSGGNAPKFIFAVKLGLIRKMLQINAKEAFEVEIFRPPFCSTFCSTGKGNILPYFASRQKKKLPISFENQEFAVHCFSSKWCHQESNRGHKDFQSFALPTELWHRLFCVLVMQRYNNFLN